MPELIKKTCEACRADAPLATEAEIAEYKLQIPQWEIVERDRIRRLERAYTFDSYAGALAFTSSVGALAEHENHHPAILTEYKRVTVWWWTHKIEGLHVNDFVMAAKTDLLA